MKFVTTPLAGVLIFAVISCAYSIAPYASDDADDQHSSHFNMAQADDHHAHHLHMMGDATKRSVADYTLPQVKLMRDDGKSVYLTDELNDGRPVVMNFIFTSCTTVCPVSSRTFSQFQDELGSERDKVHMVSISIDPEQDTPSILKKYASKYGAGPEWHFYTGTIEASIAMQQAFGVYRGDKMDQPPVTLLRAAPGKPWLRIDGFASVDDLLHEYRELIASR